VEEFKSSALFKVFPLILPVCVFYRIKQEMHLHLEARFPGTHPQTSQTGSGRAKSPCRTVQPKSDCLWKVKWTKQIRQGVKKRLLLLCSVTGRAKVVR